MKTILCYGDSNTWGMVPMTSLDSSTRHAPADRWPRVVQEQLGSPFRVIDEGLNGPGAGSPRYDDLDAATRIDLDGQPPRALAARGAQVARLQ